MPHNWHICFDQHFAVFDFQNIRNLSNTKPPMRLHGFTFNPTNHQLKLAGLSTIIDSHAFHGIVCRKVVTF